MTVYKYFIKSALKHKNIIISYAVIFFILSIISSPLAESDPDGGVFKENELTLAVVNRSQSQLSKSFIDYLDYKNIVTIEEKNKEELKELLFLQAIEAAIIIPEDFEELVIGKKEALEVIRDERRIESIYITSEINKFLSFANASYSNGEFDLAKVQAILKEEASVEIVQDDYAKDNAINGWFKSYFNFTGYVIVAIYVIVIGLVMRDFNDEEIQDRMRVSSKKFLRFNAEIYLGQVTLAIFITSMFILGAIVLKGGSISDVQFSKYLVNISMFSFSILGFTFLINNITRNRFVINALGTVTSLGTSLISGIMVSQDFLGENVLKIARFFPTYYFVRVNESNISSFGDVKYEIFMQLLFGVGFFLAGLYFAKVKRKA
nr:ABC transporter permease [Tissierella sp.]